MQFARAIEAAVRATGPAEAGPVECTHPSWTSYPSGKGKCDLCGFIGWEHLHLVTDPAEAALALDAGEQHE